MILNWCGAAHQVTENLSEMGCLHYFFHPSTRRTPCEVKQDWYCSGWRSCRGPNELCYTKAANLWSKNCVRWRRRVTYFWALKPSRPRVKQRAHCSPLTARLHYHHPSLCTFHAWLPLVHSLSTENSLDAGHQGVVTRCSVRTYDMSLWSDISSDITQGFITQFTGQDN